MAVAIRRVGHPPRTCRRRGPPPEDWRPLMSFSVNTNTGAQVALQYLNQTQGQLDQTQSAINSGLKVASAKDNGAIYAIAQNQRGAVAGYSSVINSINNGSSAIDVALSAGQSISDLLIQLKQQALPAADPSLDTASRQAINANFTALREVRVDGLTARGIKRGVSRGQGLLLQLDQQIRNRLARRKGDVDGGRAVIDGVDDRGITGHGAALILGNGVNRAIV